MSVPKPAATIPYEPPADPVDEYVLRRPVTVYGHIYESLWLRRLRAEDMEATDGLGKHAGAIVLISRATNTRPAVVRKLDVEDYDALSERVGSFFASGPPTGGDASPDSG